nr:hypothetical protein [Deltaproteobacteria bacterium]
SANRTGPFPASPIGITLALQARAAEIAPCWHDWKDAHPEGPNQPILAVALGQQGLMDARLSGADGEEFDACVKRAMTDATFDPPDVEFLTLMVPILLPNE